MGTDTKDETETPRRLCEKIVISKVIMNKKEYCKFTI